MFADQCEEAGFLARQKAGLSAVGGAASLNGDGE
jgi:hypothetical protein